jgi:hypothetical protein
MLNTTPTPIIVPADLTARLDQLHGLYGRDQSLSHHLDGLNARLAQARQIYGPTLSLQHVVTGLYTQLDELRQLYGSDSAEDVLTSIIARKKRYNRLVELQSKMMLSTAEYERNAGHSKRI